MDVRTFPQPRPDFLRKVGVDTIPVRFPQAEKAIMAQPNPQRTAN
jgi:hypothetical protein